jgi:hypothetical protein
MGNCPVMGSDRDGGVWDPDYEGEKATMRASSLRDVPDWVPIETIEILNYPILFTEEIYIAFYPRSGGLFDVGHVTIEFAKDGFRGAFTGYTIFEPKTKNARDHIEYVDNNFDEKNGHVKNVRLKVTEKQYDEIHNYYKTWKDRLEMTDKERGLTEDLLRTRQRQAMQYQEAIKQKIAEEEQLISQSAINEINAYILEYGKEKGYKLILGANGSGCEPCGDYLELTRALQLGNSPLEKGAWGIE